MTFTHVLDEKYFSFFFSCQYGKRYYIRNNGLCFVNSII